jgi:hypothetical protein
MALSSVGGIRRFLAVPERMIPARIAGVDYVRGNPRHFPYAVSIA